GRWLLALPAHHVAGAQVIVRALLAGRPPTVLDIRGGFRPDSFATAAAGLPASGRRYTSLVPTQLHRVLTDPRANQALRSFDAVLVGGAATSPGLLTAARGSGLNVVTTYGMSETAGGCVYDGLPLDGVRVRLGPDGRIELAGPMLASGYLGDRAATESAFVDGWFRTSDFGHWNGHHLTVLGRADDVITTGGESVHPAAVERVLTAQPDVRASCVVGLTDPEWGQLVAAAVVLEPVVEGSPDPATWAAAVRAELGPRSVPRRVRVVAELPLRGVGKPDRAAVARLLSETLPR
nr:AMP-binding protein [Actinomycetota bacterium]